MMEIEDSLLSRLKKYGETDVYPFHMPGHKRRLWAQEWGNPIAMDITEIDGFDNLHAPEGILKESMERAAHFYGSEKSYYLVNGSTCGILSAICACTSHGGHIILGRNCHKSAYNGIFLNGLHASYVYPQWIAEYGMDGGYLLSDVQAAVEKDPLSKAVLLVSPTYEGVVSDIGAIAGWLHERGILLIVDEAHGAHFPFGEEGQFPKSALKMGADVVIQSLHKTLPSPTQTAILHVQGTLVDRERLERYLHIYQSSSPSYILMAGIDRCVRGMMEEGRELMKAYGESLSKLRERLSGLNHIRVPGRGELGAGVYDLDPSKLVLSVLGTDISGRMLMEELRQRYHLELEMSAPTYALAMTTVADTAEGMERLWEALAQIDGRIGPGSGTLDLSFCQRKIRLKQSCTMAEALEGRWESVSWADSVGRTAAETVFVYPPGIPIVVPGEVISEAVIEAVEMYEKQGFPVQGLSDESRRRIRVMGNGG